MAKVRRIKWGKRVIKDTADSHLLFIINLP